MTNPICTPIADGVYEHNGSIISVGRGQNLAVSEKKRHMRIWVGELPDGWRLCELVDALDPARTSVPVEVQEAARLICNALEARIGAQPEIDILRAWLDGLKGGG